MANNNIFIISCQENDNYNIDEITYNELMETIREIQKKNEKLNEVDQIYLKNLLPSIKIILSNIKKILTNANIIIPDNPVNIEVIRNDTIEIQNMLSDINKKVLKYSILKLLTEEMNLEQRKIKLMNDLDDLISKFRPNSK